MYKLLFVRQISENVKARIARIFNDYYQRIQDVILLSDQEIEVLIHYSDNGVLDGEANMLQRYLILHVNDSFSDQEFLILLGHELFHIAHYDFFGVRETNMDVIIDEGMAIIAENKLRGCLKLDVKTQDQTWRVRLKRQEILRLLEKATDQSLFFDDNWNDLLLNKDLQNKNFADNSIYQVGFWLANKIMREQKMSFEEIVVKDGRFWEKQIAQIIRNQEVECR